MTVAHSFSSASRGQSAGSFVSFCELFLSFLSVRYDDRGVVVVPQEIGSAHAIARCRRASPGPVGQVYFAK